MAPIEGENPHGSNSLPGANYHASPDVGESHGCAMNKILSGTKFDAKGARSVKYRMYFIHPSEHTLRIHFF